ncbi:hypothetical protein KM043_008776 [Ampulex compressa]|nr:hypothetical protein KM043_008776 [Ampulex compressa]
MSGYIDTPEETCMRTGVHGHGSVLVRILANRASDGRGNSHGTPLALHICYEFPPTATPLHPTSAYCILTELMFVPTARKTLLWEPGTVALSTSWILNAEEERRRGELLWTGCSSSTLEGPNPGGPSLPPALLDVASDRDDVRVHSQPACPGDYRADSRLTSI